MEHLKDKGPPPGMASRALSTRFNSDLAVLPAQQRINIGIHVSLIIVSEKSYARATSFTAISNTINTASRLETMTKEFAAQLVIS